MSQPFLARRPLSFGDFHAGQLIIHPYGRTISEADNTWFTLLTNNTNQIHFNRHYAAGTEFGDILVNSTLTLSLITGLSVVDLSETAIANLGWSDVKLLKPVFIGDTLYARSLVVSKRKSKSRPGQGILTVETTGYKSDGSVCITFVRSILLPLSLADSEPAPPVTDDLLQQMKAGTDYI